MSELSLTASARTEGAPVDDPRPLWRIGKDLELYSSYLDLTLKATAFVLAITGAIVSYCLAHHGESLDYKLEEVNWGPSVGREVW